jgi:tetratricopeptide (TPR) repeat protein
MNRSAEAVVLARTAIEGLRQAPETPETRLLLGRSYALLAHSIWARDAEAGTSAAEHAVGLVEQVIERHGDLPDLGVALSDVAWAYTALGDPQRAVSVCEEYLRRETAAEHRLVALMLLAEALRLVGRLTEASDVATQALVYSEFDPLTRPVLHNTLGLIERAAGRRHEARQSFEAALGVLRHDPFRAGSSELLGTIYGNLAELYYETGNFDGAIAMFRELLGQYREDSAFYWQVVTCLADCHAAKGSYEEARRYYREVLMAEAAEDEQRASAGEGLAALPAP